MSKQPTLFDPDPPHVAHSGTSRAAAESVAPVAGRLRQRVLEYIRSRGAEGATDEETGEALSMPGNTVRPRRVELERMQLVADSGRTRKTKAGRKAVVWCAAEFLGQTEAA